MPTGTPFFLFLLVAVLSQDERVGKGNTQEECLDLVSFSALVRRDTSCIDI